MADSIVQANPAFPKYTNAPQPFAWNGTAYIGLVTKWSGATTRRKATHNFLKRTGAIQEDMARGPRWIELQLEFITDSRATAAAKCNAFERLVDETPIALLQHPIAGQWMAFCDGLKHDVDFSRATNEIHASVRFEETSLDSKIPPDAPSVQSSAQKATDQSSIMKTAVAGYMGTVGIVHAHADPIIAKIQSTIRDLGIIVDPITEMRNVLHTVGGIESSILGLISDIYTAGILLDQDINNFVDSAATNNIFDGSDPKPASANQAKILLGACVADCEALVDLLIKASSTPAGAAEAVGAAEEALAAAYVVELALEAEKPPLIDYVVPALTDLVSIALVLYPGDNTTARALEILALNRINNPAVITGGTVLKVYAK